MSADGIDDESLRFSKSGSASARVEILADIHKLGDQRKSQTFNGNSIQTVDLSKSPWERLKDYDGNVYYYNSRTGKSTWLAPCSECGKTSVKWCVNCRKSFCERDHKSLHGPRAINESFQQHEWSTHEIYKEDLKPGQAYCIACTTKAASKMCITCWDPYCDECFSSIHFVGDLLRHIAEPYKKTKKGWVMVKGHGKQPDYFINGTTGESTFEKPEHLMTDLERLHTRNFKAIKKEVEEELKTIEKLQFDLEAVKYERDRRNEEVQASAEAARAARKKAERAQEMLANSALSPIKKKSDAKEAVGLEASQEVLNTMKRNNANRNAPVFGKDNIDYRDALMNPTERRRGKARTDFIKSLLESPTSEG